MGWNRSEPGSKVSRRELRRTKRKRPAAAALTRRVDIGLTTKPQPGLQAYEMQRTLVTARATLLEKKRRVLKFQQDKAQRPEEATEEEAV